LLIAVNAQHENSRPVLGGGNRRAQAFFIKPPGGSPRARARWSLAKKKHKNGCSTPVQPVQYARRSLIDPRLVDPACLRPESSQLVVEARVVVLPGPPGLTQEHL
jgi:hypothetical protein